MDISQTTQPRSDQLNFDDVSSRSLVATVTEVRAGTSEQPVEVHLAEFPGRPYKPSKSMRRVLLAAWGNETDNYVGRRLKLAGDPTIRFGGTAVGGIKIEALSHLNKPLSIALTVTKGKRAPFRVEPLPDAPVPADQVSKAVTAVHGATTTVKLDEIVAHARRLGIDGAAELVAAVEQKRGELGSATDHTGGGQ